VVTKKKSEGYEIIIIDNGKYQLAMVTLSGWERAEVVHAKGLHPESNESAVINCSSDTKSAQSNVYATLMLWKKSGEKWKNEELVPVKTLSKANDVITVQFKNGKKITLDFNAN
jgi:hypothetical protein